VRAEAPTDQHVLHTMGMVYRGADCMSRLTAAYAAASAKEPSDLGLLTAVFGGYVRYFEASKTPFPNGMRIRLRARGRQVNGSLRDSVTDAVSASVVHPTRKRRAQAMPGLARSSLTACDARCRRDGDYVQQQRVAMRLSKMAGAGAGPQYLWWAVTSLLLQARAAAAGAPGCVKGL